MTRNSLGSGKLLCSLILACSAQDVRLSGPITGLVFDSPTQSLRQIVGLPGAAVLGHPLLSDVEWASVAPNGRVALVLRHGEVRCFFAGEHPEDVPVQGTVSIPALSAWAIDSSAVAVYSPANLSAQWIRLTNQGPVADAALPLSWTAPGVTAFAADEKSGLLIFAVTGRGVYRIGTAMDPVLLLPTGDVPALALEPGGQTLWIADRATAKLVQISVTEAITELIIGPDADRLTDLSAMALSSARNYLFLANRTTRRLYIYDRSSTLIADGAELYATATMFRPLGRSSVFLLGQRSRIDESVYLLDESAGPAVLFVPAVEMR